MTDTPTRRSMELINATRMAAGYNIALEPSGHELLVVVVKGTFVLPKPGEQVRLTDEQIPLVVADTFSAAPGLSAPKYEIDYAPRKHACDVLLLGHARAPEGREVTRLRVGLRMGSMEKAFDVVGDRVWQAGLVGIRASPPLPFSKKTVSYDTAFGGADRNSDDPAEHGVYLSNPVGRGWHKHLHTASVDGAPLPNTEEVDRAVVFPTHPYRPMALGPVGRGWPQRAKHAGTYDQAWIDEVFPFLPSDFDERYYQAAPVEQQMPLPVGPIEATLAGFTADGVRRWQLPHSHAPVHIFPRSGGREVHSAVLDTIVVEPDHERFSLTWRVSRRLKKSIFEIAQVRVGAQGPERWQQDKPLEFPRPATAPVPAATR